MADNTTDKLIIDIKVNVKKGATTQITNLTKSLTELNKVVAKVGNLERYANALRQIGKGVSKTTSNTGVAKSRGNANFLETTNVDVSKQKIQTKEVQKQEKSIKNIVKDKQKQVKLDEDSNKENKKSSSFFSKFARSIGRIALYRAIRTSLSGIVKMFQEGLQNIRAFDEATDKSFKKMEASSTTFKNSIASLFTSIIQGVQPYITQITDAIGNMVNRFNEAQAVLNGSDKYMKVLTSDTKEWQEQIDKVTGNLLEFDKFLSLNNEESYSGLVSADVTMSKDEAQSINSSIQGIKTALIGIVTAIGLIKATQFIGWISGLKDKIVLLKDSTNLLNTVLNTGLLVGIGLIVTGVIDLIANWDNLDAKGKAVRIMIVGLGVALTTYSTLMKISLKDTTSLTNAFKLQKVAMGALMTGGFLALAGGIVSVISNWKDMGTVAKWLVPIISVLVGVVTALAMALYFVKGNWAKAIATGALVTGTGLMVGSALSAQKMADGGMVEKGTSFIAGEAGAEVVHTSARGTGVTNIEQFSQAMLQALATYGVARGSDVSFKGDVYINQTKAGQLLESSVYGEGVRVGHFKRA